ncbi:class I SAM-dependent methyltransferase [Glycomyces salinus]|uniref:class I SAM-dependent methyltransferase n=1 Tax=Glycomyces salinus TaxID=980294 RepID=UPI0018ED3AA3|nr:class I SAM-dependent methyltransferase [Glycomyces salinus]
MTELDKDGWERHWRRGRDGEPGSMSANPPNPYLVEEIGGLAPGSALDAGCGAGAEAIWLASAGWRVTAVDISPTALAIAAERAATGAAADRIRWVEADLSVWDPGTGFDLVATHYAHPATPQLDFYDRIAEWVAPGGTLLIVGHLHTHDTTGHDHRPPAEVSVDAAAVSARLPGPRWRIATAGERARTLPGPDGRATTIHDVIVRATRSG